MYDCIRSILLIQDFAAVHHGIVLFLYPVPAICDIMHPDIPLAPADPLPQASRTAFCFIFRCISNRYFSVPSLYAGPDSGYAVCSGRRDAGGPRPALPGAE